MIQGIPSRTARSVAILRAVHQRLDGGCIFHDPFAARMLDAAASAVVTDSPWQCNHTLLRRTRAFVAARSRYAEDALHEAFKNGVRQYVVLGAGLDTFAWRNPYPNLLKVFEVDHPATQAWKRESLSRNGLEPPSSLVYVALDFASNSLEIALKAHGFDADAPAFFSWLGVSCYLDRRDIDCVVRWVATLPAPSGIVFDYALPVAQLGPMERLGYELVASQAAAMGEPWKSAFSPQDMQMLLASAGFKEAASVDHVALGARYLPTPQFSLRIGGGFAIAKAGC